MTYHSAMLSSRSVRNWISGMKAGKEEAFEAFVGHYWESVFRVAARFVPSGDDAEEWTELVLLHAVDRIQQGKLQFVSVASFNSWMFRLAGRKCIEFWRRRKRSREIATESERLAENPAPSNASPSGGVEQTELQRIVMDAVDKIPKANLKTTLLLVLEEGLTVAEIAVKMGRPINTIRTWERRGKQYLREILEREYPEIVGDFG